MAVHSMDFPVFAPSRSISLGQVWQHVAAMLEARRTRQLLAELDGRMLADIGVGRGDALMEAARPMWDLTVQP